MVKIRLRRTGAKKQPSYRVVVADSRAPRDGAFIEIIGHYNPLTDPPTIVIEKEKALAWLGKGAQPTPTTARLLSKAGIREESKSATPRHPVTAQPPDTKPPKSETEEKK
ncbi:MAG: 30S ribosomal protein S16 [Chloroflexi bacterium]|nr:30S ribosomal protein S16 [Chloroflexota bacterium]